MANSKDKTKLVDELLRESIPNRLLIVPGSLSDSDYWKTATRYQFWYSLGGLVLGLTSMVGGIVLFLHGVIGSTSWTAKFLGASSQVTDAAPGAILFIVGLLVVYVTRYVVKPATK